MPLNKTVPPRQFRWNKTLRCRATQRINLLRALRAKAHDTRNQSAREYAASEAGGGTNRLLLQHAIRAMVSSRNDPRARFEFLRLLPQASLLSVLTPLEKAFDPLHTYPQLFIFDRSYAAVPLFTSFECLDVFTKRFSMCVRGPDDALWSSSNCEEHSANNPLWKSLPDSSYVMTKATRLLCSSHAATKDPSGRTDERSSEEMDDAHLIQQSDPIFLFGYPIKSYLIGCLAPSLPLLQMTECMPERVDIVLNPGSTLQWRISRAMSRELQVGSVVNAKLYHEICSCMVGEFASFFRTYCPEVSAAFYLVLPREMIDTGIQGSHGHTFRIVFLLDTLLSPEVSSGFPTAIERIKHARRTGYLKGHSCLILLSWGQAPKSYHDAATTFYLRDQAHTDQSSQALIYRSQLQPGEPIKHEGAFRVYDTNISQPL